MSISIYNDARYLIDSLCGAVISARTSSTFTKNANLRKLSAGSVARNMTPENANLRSINASTAQGMGSVRRSMKHHGRNVQATNVSKIS